LDRRVPLNSTALTSHPIPVDLPEDTVATYVPPGAKELDSQQATAAATRSVLPTWSIDVPDTSSVNRTANAVEPSAASDRVGYRLMHRVGAGGMGEVWSALQATLERPVAVKRLLPARLQTSAEVLAGVVAEFRLEAMVAGRLEHPNIVPIHDLGTDDSGLPLIAMKLVEGDNWADLAIADFPQMTAPDFIAKHLPILVNVANAVAFAHSRGIVHRDLKPGQVMVGAFGEVLLMDWGLAIAWKDTTHADSPSLVLPTPGNASGPAGTPALMAPEQTLTNTSSIGPHTDVFLLGATLYYLLTGTYPYQAPSSQAAFLKALAAEQQAPEQRAPGRWIPQELADIAMKAMAPRIEDRFPSADAFRQAIADWMTGAARRREAQALLEEAATALDEAPREYAALDAILQRLGRAISLWGDAPLSKELEAQAHEAYARLALAANDLTLARSHALQAAPGKTQAALIADIDGAMTSQRRRDSQRRLAIFGVLTLMTILLLGGAMFTHNLNQAWSAEIEARQEAERNVRLIRHQESSAAGLVNFMLGDLRKALDEELLKIPNISQLEINRTTNEIAARVIQPVFEYYMEQEPERLPRELQLAYIDRTHTFGENLVIFRMLDQADAIASRVDDLMGSTVGQRNQRYARALRHRGRIAWDQYKFDEAIEHLEHAIQISDEVDGPGHAEAAESMSVLASVFRSKGERHKSRELLDASIPVLERELGINSSHTIRTLITYSGLLIDMGDLAAARTTIEDAIARLESMDVIDDQLVALAHLNYGRVAQDEEDHRTAERAFGRAAEYFDHLYGPRNTYVAYANLGKGRAMQATGRAKEAVELIKTALPVIQDVEGPETQGVSAVYDALGAAYVGMSDYSNAAKAFEETLRIRQAVLPPDHTEIAAAMGSLSFALERTGETSRALELSLRAIEIGERTYEHGHYRLGYMYLSGGVIYRRAGELEKSRESLQRAVDILLVSFGEDHPSVATALNDLAVTLRRLKRYDEAKEKMELALAIRHRILKRNAFRTVVTHLDLGIIEAMRGDIAAAKRQREIAFAAMEDTTTSPPENYTNAKVAVDFLDQAITSATLEAAAAAATESK